MNVSLENIISSIRGLPPTDRARLRRLLDTDDLDGTSEEQGNSRRTQSLHWLQENRKDYLGLWVALDGDRLIASGKSARQVFDAAKKAGVFAPFVELVTDEESVPYTGGWLS